MRMDAGCELVIRVFQETPLVTVLRPRRGQRLLDDRFVVAPSLAYTQYVDAFGNWCQRLTLPPGELRIVTSTSAYVEPHVVVNRHAMRAHAAKLPDQALQFTLPSRYCPSDRLSELARSIVPASASGYEQVQAIRDYVHDTLDYRYGVSNGSTDALETLALGVGVCRDFAHVCIALCRALDIPARMVVGYLHGLQPMDLHAWFEAYVGDRWYTFDATEDTLEGGRIVVAHGRDAADVAFMTDYGALELQRMNVWTSAQSAEDDALLSTSIAVAS